MKKILAIAFLGLFLASCGGKTNFADMPQEEKTKIIKDIQLEATKKLQEMMKDMSAEEKQKIHEKALEITKEITKEKYPNIDFGDDFGELK